MLDQLKRAVTRGTASRTGSSAQAFRECRRCGTTVEEAIDGCPACGSTEIAHYEF